MTYPTSENTKQALAAALKQCMKQKPLDKISIREITDLCGLRRETFYYHFSDIYALVKWMFEEEALTLLRRHEGVQLPGPRPPAPPVLAGPAGHRPAYRGPTVPGTGPAGG